MTSLALDTARWIRARATQTVVAALQAGDTDEVARFVGGCVRNTLLGRGVDDVDIATRLEPQTVIARLEAAGLKAVPTGLDHGTVTGIAFGKPFEITTLRQDVRTDGRHAQVTFTQDWAQDARRRDFTMNALYAGADGTLHDPLGGLPDLEAGQVRFIGDAVTRIREDYLRILRFFRFQAWYGRSQPDAEALAAITAEREGLAGLSGERVQKELFKLLQADDPVPALRAMAESGVLEGVLPEVKSLDHLAALVPIEQELMLPPDSVRRLASLLSDRVRLPNGFAARLKLSNAVRTRLTGLLIGDWDMIDKAEGAALRVLIYDAGVDRTADLRLLAAAACHSGADAVADTFDALRRWDAPEFPLKGADITAAGVPKGPEVGAHLKALEDWWIAQDFKPSKNVLKAELTRRIAKG